MPGLTVFRLASGKIEEVWNRYNELGMGQQLGLAPTPGQAIPLEQPGLETPLL